MRRPIGPVLAFTLCTLAAAAMTRAEDSAAEKTSKGAEETKAAALYTSDERNHWSFLPRSQPAVPRFSDDEAKQWMRSDIDAFVLQRLRKEKLSFSPQADRRTLIRRLTYDLTGLPPTPAEVAAFLTDKTPTAYEKLVNRLLASPRYGERWGQHWLDVVRFSETEGFEYDRYRAGSWRYRDYVIQSFNADKPFDQFVTEQLAGDEIDANNRDLQVAVGFHRLGPIRRNQGNAEVAFSRNEVLTEMIDGIGVSLLGMTIGCARCHDHMFDPVRQVDYYRFQAFLAATHENDIPLTTEAEAAAWKKKTDEITGRIKKLRVELAKADGQPAEKLRADVKRLEIQLPAPLPTVSSVRNIADQRSSIHLLARGDESQKKQRLGMRYLGVLLTDDAPELPADTPGPRTRLAKWITDPAHPLTARVIVNRIWQNHFGRGIVSTPNDFGFNGMSPTHPELLDFLANRFVAEGWKFKPLHRLIVMSATYRQGSATTGRKAALAKDPGNRWLWRFQRRRLQAEEIRDSMLAVAGTINLETGGPSIMLPVEQELIDLLYKPSQWKVTADEQSHSRRSIYLIAKRNLRLPFLEVFDQPDLQTSCAGRIATTHSPQALELLNGKFSNQMAVTLANRLRRDAGKNSPEQVEQGYQLTAGRSPTDRERTIALAFLKQHPLEDFTLALLNLNAFLYVE